MITIIPQKVDLKVIKSVATRDIYRSNNAITLTFARGNFDRILNYRANLIIYESPPLQARGRRDPHSTISRWIADRIYQSIYLSRRDTRAFPVFKPTLIGAVSSGLFTNTDRNQRYTHEHYGAPTDRCNLHKRITILISFGDNFENVLSTIIIFLCAIMSVANKLCS